jgi:hypothetical protein
MQKNALLAIPIDQDTTTKERARPRFSEETLLQHIVNFIVADDQVRHTLLHHWDVAQIAILSRSWL